MVCPVLASDRRRASCTGWCLAPAVAFADERRRLSCLSCLSIEEIVGLNRGCRATSALAPHVLRYVHHAPNHFTRYYCMYNSKLYPNMRIYNVKTYFTPSPDRREFNLSLLHTQRPRSCQRLSCKSPLDLPPVRVSRHAL